MAAAAAESKRGRKGGEKWGKKGGKKRRIRRAAAVRECGGRETERLRWLREPAALPAASGADWFTPVSLRRTSCLLRC